MDNTTAKTFQATFELVDEFDAVRVIFGSNDPSNSVIVNAAAVSAPASAAEVNNPSGEWMRVAGQGESEFAVPIAPPGKDRLAFAVTDWVPLASVPRADGGAYPLLTVRARMAPNAALPVLGNGRDNFSNWASRSDGGRKFWWRHQDGDRMTVPSTFTSTINRSQSPILGVQYLCRNQVVTVAAVGDSITEGRGTYLGEGFVLPVLEEFNDVGGSVKYEYANFGWSGQSPADYSERAINLMESEIKPDVLVIPAGSPNPASAGVLTDVAIAGIRTDLERMLRSAWENAVLPLVWTWIPTNSAVRAYGNSDIKRVAHNSEVLASSGPNLLVADAATPMSGPINGGQVQMAGGTSNDGIHPNDFGNGILMDALRPLLLAAAQRSQRGR